MPVRTRDLYLAAYLRARGLEIEGVTRKSGVIYFIFREHEDSNRLLSEYIQDRALVDPKVFRNCLRDLKSVISGDIPLPEVKP